MWSLFSSIPWHRYRHVLDPRWALPATTITPHVIAFSKLLEPAFSPLLVPCEPTLLYGDEPVPMGQCYANVERYCELVGGTHQYGWLISQRAAGAYLYAYHHCVHQDGTTLLDVSIDDQDCIIYLPSALPGQMDRHPRNEFGGVRSQFYAVSSDPLVARIIECELEMDKYQTDSPEWCDAYLKIVEANEAYYRSTRRRREWSAGRERRQDKKQQRRRRKRSRL
jgi:hypothetical protein